MSNSIQDALKSLEDSQDREAAAQAASNERRLRELGVRRAYFDWQRLWKDWSKVAEDYTSGSDDGIMNLVSFLQRAVEIQAILDPQTANEFRCGRLLGSSERANFVIAVATSIMNAGEDVAVEELKSLNARPDLRDDAMRHRLAPNAVVYPRRGVVGETSLLSPPKPKSMAMVEVPEDLGRPIAATQRVRLFALGVEPVAIVDGCPIASMSRVQHLVLSTLMDAPDGLTGSELDRKSRRTGARQHLSRLRAECTEWAAVIYMPGRARDKYRVT